MPRMNKQDKLEWSFFLSANGRKKFNSDCCRCKRDCKQSYRAYIVACLKYLSKRAKKS